MSVFFSLDAAGDHRIDLGVLGLDRRLAAVEQRDLPVAARAGPLAADDELAGLAGLLVDGVGDDRRHDGADEADAHDHDDLLALGPGRPGEGLDALQLGRVILRFRQLELLPGRTHGILAHALVPYKSQWLSVHSAMQARRSFDPWRMR